MRKMKFIIALHFASALFFGCTSAINENKSQVSDASQRGLWRQIGYGRILELNDSTIKVYDLNTNHCMLTFEEDILDFAMVGGVEDDTLTLKHGIDRWKCVRIQELPKRCVAQMDNKPNDPLSNYDIFWQNFKEHYCSFELKEIDWEKVNEKFRPTISKETSELELYQTLEEMIALLEDGHIKMDVPESIEDEYRSSSNKKANKYNKLDVFETAESIARLYVDSLRSFNAGMTRWGMIGESIGYVQINMMLMQADYHLEESLSLQEFQEPYWVDNVMQTKDEIYRQEEADGMKKTLDRLLAEMPLATDFIVDLRFNSGGKDGVAMEILNHFSSHHGIMARKYVHENGQFVNHQSIVNAPASNGFKGSVYLLTSHETASSAELVVLCSMADDKFTRIGSVTEGIFSSTLDKRLPIGWDYEFSNEIYEDLKGNNYEHVGISPDVIIDYSNDLDEFIDQLKSEVESNADTAIENALKLINEKSKS